MPVLQGSTRDVPDDPVNYHISDKIVQSTFSKVINTHPDEKILILLFTRSSGVTRTNTIISVSYIVLLEIFYWDN